MCTDDNLKSSCFTFLLAITASLSIFGLGFLNYSDLKVADNPLSLNEGYFSNEKSFVIKSDGVMLSNSSPHYYQPQVTAMDNPYEERVVETLTVELTGYSSTVDQTNSQPFITASGAGVRWGIVAANFLEFGTKIRIPDYFGDEVFVVKDRMNTRYNSPSAASYGGYVDIWFYSRQEATNFGRVKGIIEILE